jgi:hypothetical protein
MLSQAGVASPRWWVHPGGGSLSTGRAQPPVRTGPVRPISTVTGRPGRKPRRTTGSRSPDRIQLPIRQCLHSRKRSTASTVTGNRSPWGAQYQRQVRWCPRAAWPQECRPGRHFGLIGGFRSADRVVVERDSTCPSMERRPVRALEAVLTRLCQRRRHLGRQAGGRRLGRKVLVSASKFPPPGGGPA